jgi:hypothetical protein
LCISTNTQVISHAIVDVKSLKFAPEFDKWTNEFRGVFKIGAVDCDTYADLCKKEDITEFPTIKLYAPIPIPPTKYTVFL